MAITQTKQLASLCNEPRAAITTAEAAMHLNRAEQTLRLWACKGNGPVQPLRLHGRLAWRVQDLKRLLGVAA